jgi:ribose 5-phosphate isomerase B
MRLVFAGDHAGFALKSTLVEAARAAGHDVTDAGCRSTEGVDLSDFVAPAAADLGAGKFDRAIFVDGAGYPSGMIANFHHGVFAAVANDPVSAKLAREHSAANALCVGAMVIGELMAREILSIFLTTEPLGGKYARRVEKVRAIGEARRLGPVHRVRELVTVADLQDAIARKEPLVIGERTVITPSVLDGVRGMRP